MKYGDELKVGIIVVIAIALFTVGVIFFGDYEVGTKRYHINLIFDDVEGLQYGDPVTMSGVKIGTVKNMSLRGHKVIVDISVRPEVRIPDDSRAYVAPVGFMGEKSINLKLGNHTTMVRPGGSIQGTIIADLAQLAPSAAPILDEMRDVLERIREFLDQQTETDVRESLKNMSEATAGIRKIVTNDLDNLQNVMKNMEGTTSNLQEMSEKEKAKVDTILSHLQETSARLTTLTENLTTTSASFNRVAERLDRGDGTLGRLLVDDSLYKQFEQVVSSADSLIQDVKAHPQKYMHIEIF